MCNIIVLAPGQMPVRFEFDNMCWNNWHAFGLVTLIDGKLDITKKPFVNEEINPEVIWNLLKRDIEHQRILHVRHITAGQNTLMNTHPFEVYYDDNRHVVFMHNGTLPKFKSKMKNQHGSEVDDNSGPSDSKNFVDQIIQPLISKDGDYTSPFARKILEEFWAYDNRGILISNDLPVLYLGQWKERKDDKGVNYPSANDLYFDLLKRGPEYERRDSKRKEEEAKKKSNHTPAKTYNSGGTIKVEEITKYPGVYTKNDTFRFSAPFASILDDWNVYDRDGMATLAAMTHEEVQKLLNHGDDSVYLFDLLICDYEKMYQELLLADEKHEKATKRIADLVNEMSDLKDKLKKAA